MSTTLATRSAEGALAGAAGTFILQGVMLVNQQFAPDIETPESEDPASFMLWQAEKLLPREAWMKIPASAETAAGIALSVAYGTALGALYGALSSQKPNLLRDGAIVGLGVWAIGYLGWLPAARLIPPVWKQEPKQMVGPIIEHLAYGFATAAAFSWLTKRW